jgi:hypothetical protein
MPDHLHLLGTFIANLFKSRRRLEVENLFLRHDRIILADLKHHRGRIENRGGFWHRGDLYLGPSPAHKIRENAKVLASLIQKELPQLRAVPPVESVVILTHPLADPSGLDQVERDRTLKLSEFLRITDTRQYEKLFTTRSKFDSSAPPVFGWHDRHVAKVLSKRPNF